MLRYMHDSNLISSTMYSTCTTVSGPRLSRALQETSSGPCTTGHEQPTWPWALSLNHLSWLADTKMAPGLPELLLDSPSHKYTFEFNFNCIFFKIWCLARGYLVKSAVSLIRNNFPKSTFRNVQEIPFTWISGV